VFRQLHGATPHDVELAALWRREDNRAVLRRLLDHVAADVARPEAA
jgi:hypothetical protein